eukprot:m.180742 g.180742  ORF g.180742 m.180742 type:complete len:270 (+) comp18432_c0_seq3:207-1016(+)
MDNLEATDLSGDSVFNTSNLADTFDIGDLFTNSAPLQLQPFPDHGKGSDKSVLPQSSNLSASSGKPLSLLFPGDKPWQRLGNTAVADAAGGMKKAPRDKNGADKATSEPSSHSGNGSSPGEADSGNSGSRSPPTVAPKSSRSAARSSATASGSGRTKSTDTTRRRNAGKAKSAAERRRDIRSRKERARVSARDCRARKKEYVQDLERKVQYLEREHLEQLERIKQMSNRIAELEAHIRRQQTDQALWAAANLSLELDTSSSAGMGTDGG